MTDEEVNLVKAAKSGSWVTPPPEHWLLYGSGVLKVTVPDFWPAPLLRSVPGHRPCGPHQDEDQQSGRGGPREQQPVHPPPRHPGEKLRGHQGVRDLPEGEHERADTGVVFDLKTEVRVQVHLGEKVGILALPQQPALTLEPGGGGLIDLMELAQLVQGHEAHDHGTREGRQRDHKLGYPDG